MFDPLGFAIILLAILAGILVNHHDWESLRREMRERFDSSDPYDQADPGLDIEGNKRLSRVDQRLDLIDSRIIELNRAIGNLEGRQAALDTPTDTATA